MSLPKSAETTAAPPAPVARRPRRLARRRFWLALAAAILLALPCYPPAWHATLRTWLGWQARRHGYALSVASIRGGLFDTTQLYGVRCRPLPGNALGTDLSVARADLTLAWASPWRQRFSPSWVRCLVLDGVRGRWDFGRPARPAASPPSVLPGVDGRGPTLAAIPGDATARLLAAVLPPLRWRADRFVPETFLVRADDLRLVRGRYQASALGLRLSGARDDAGQFLAREVRIAGPGFDSTLHLPHGQTYWQGSRLTVSGLPLGPDVRLVSATLDGSHLDRHRLGWEGRLTALGGEVRGEGRVGFAHERLALEVAASLQGAALRPLARLLGVGGVPIDGVIDQANFTFRGDPEDWPAAQTWLAVHATDFRWDRRRWEDLDLQAVVVNRRVQVHRLELRQRGNRLSLTGECSLPPAPADAPTAADALRRWRAGGFSARVDARLDDLRALAELFGPDAPALEGRMSVNGALSAPPGAGAPIDGYLNVEGTRLVLRGAPLDFLRSTLVFRDGGLRVADLQATHDADYFTGTGSLRLDGPPRCEGELRAEARRLAAYTPALAGLPPPLADGLARVTGVSALLRWDDSVLRVEEFQGRFEGAPFMVGGTVGLADPAHPVLDLSLDGKNVGLWDTAARARQRADCALTIRSPAGGIATLGGELRLLDGRPAAPQGMVCLGGAAPGQPWMSITLADSRENRAVLAGWYEQMRAPGGFAEPGALSFVLPGALSALPLEESPERESAEYVLRLH